MSLKKTLIFMLVSSLTVSQLHAKPIALEKLSGNWHLRVMDGMEVRKARAILDFDATKMHLSGFDGCNRINGTLEKNSSNIMRAKLMSTRMACRENIHRWVTTRLHETVNKGFSVNADTKYGVEGITLKSSEHELFFKRMERD
jgi:heat shock protein HslJ